jgi:hypothetical protein
MYKRLFLALTLLGSAYIAHAQVRYILGPQVGYTLATANYKYRQFVNHNQYRSGFSGGLTGELGIGHLTVRPAVLYAQKGYKLNQHNSFSSGQPFNVSTNKRFDYLTIPVNIAYTQRSNGQGIQVFAGGYIGFVLGGRYTDFADFASGSSLPMSTGKVVGSDSGNVPAFVLPIQSKDFGIQGGIGYRYQRLLAQVEYSMGLRNVNLTDLSGDAPTYHNRVFQLSLAYLFGAKFQPKSPTLLICSTQAPGSPASGKD